MPSGLFAALGRSYTDRHPGWADDAPSALDATRPTRWADTDDVQLADLDASDGDAK
ncbi:hypothetical protein ACWEP4_32090 [Streptomyces sp. NPDC004227]